MARTSMVAVMRVYCSFKRTDENSARAHTEHRKMCEAAEYVLRSGMHVVFSVPIGKHPDADVWDTASFLRTYFNKNEKVTVHTVAGDPFYRALQKLLPKLVRSFRYMLSVSYTSVHLLTPEVLDAVDTAFKNGASTVNIVPPDMSTGLVGAANNQCMAWELGGLWWRGGFDPRDAKPRRFDMDTDIQGVGEIIPAYKFGPKSMAIIVPNVEAGDSRDTPEQLKKRLNKERRITTWLERDGLTWEDLKKLIMHGYPVDLRKQSAA